jgi:hypothetical protein
LFATATYVPSNIVDFRPSTFQAKADAGFFYSIGEDLKYSDQIDLESPTLIHGQIKNFLVSPDTRHIAVVTNGRWMLVGRDKSDVHEVAVADSIYREPKPIGQSFFRDQELQWSQDSKSLYLVKDEFYQSQGSQLFSPKAELWRYQLETRKLELVLKPFPSDDYFFDRNSMLYFSVPTDSGDFKLRYFDGTQVGDIETAVQQGIPTSGPPLKPIDSPFFSFSIFEYASDVHSKGADLVVDHTRKRLMLEYRDKPILAITEGKGFKGEYYCSDELRNEFLPGDRYLFFNAPYCGNYNGQLLVDTFSGNYQTLPKDTGIYITLNTNNYRYYRINAGGVVAR